MPPRLVIQNADRRQGGEKAVGSKDHATPVELSIVVPLHNEASNVAPFCERLLPVLHSLDLAFEVVFVNDGSTDSTLERVLNVASGEPAVKVIDLSRQFGKEAALSCGLAHAQGQAVVALDGDLQHPPELLPELVALWREGYEMVYAQRRNRDDQDLASRVFARLFYWLFNRMSYLKLPRDAGDYRLLDRKVVDALNALPERHRFMKGMFAWVGFRTIGITYEASNRANGRSKWSGLRKVLLALDGLFSFSNLPLRIWSVVGTAISLLSFLYILVRIVRSEVYNVYIADNQSTLAVVLFLGGLQLLSLGIIGDYLGRVFEEAKQRPLYIVRQSFGIEAESAQQAQAREAG